MTVTIGLIQTTVSPDLDENLTRTVQKVKEAIAKGAKIICLQELFKTPYFPQYIGRDTHHMAEMIPGKSTTIFSSLAREHQVVIIVPLYEKAADDKYYNSAVIIDGDGSLHTPYHKVHIPQDPFFYEKGYFYPGSSYQVHNTCHGKIAVLICYDQWFPEAARSVALDGAEIIFYPTAIGHINGDNWQETWELIQRSHAVANSVHLAAVNRVGLEGSIRFFGGSFISDPFGSIIGRAGEDERIIIATLDLSMNKEFRDSWGFFRNRRPDTYARITTQFVNQPSGIREGDTPGNRGFHMPAEWEPHDAVWMAWPHDAMTFPRLCEVEDTYVRFIQAVHASERVELFVPNEKVFRHIRNLLQQAAVDLSRVSLRLHPYADVWIRDYGPSFILNRGEGRVAMVRWEFNAWGDKYDDLKADGVLPHVIRQWLDVPMFEPHIVLEGGSIDTNGRGTVLTTRSCLLHPNRNASLSECDLETYLTEYLGIQKVIWLNEGITGDDTDGHIDDIARFVGPSTVVCAVEDDPHDENYLGLLENYQILIHSTDQNGVPLRVIPLPMPGPVIEDGERYPASYTNFYISNTCVIVPIFDDPHDDQALRILQDLFTDRVVIGINACAMVEGYGTFHCATQQQPSGT